MKTEIIIRTADSGDLNAMNEVIKASIMSWPLADRVKRLSLKVLLYDETDLKHYQFIVAETDQQIVAIAAWDPDHPDSLFHGLYVSPDFQSQGLGQRLIASVISAVKALGRKTLVVKAESVSANYFIKQGFHAIPVTDHNDYPYLFCKKL